MLWGDCPEGAVLTGGTGGSGSSGSSGESGSSGLSGLSGTSGASGLSFYRESPCAVASAARHSCRRERRHGRGQWRVSLSSLARMTGPRWPQRDNTAGGGHHHMAGGMCPSCVLLWQEGATRCLGWDCRRRRCGGHADGCYGTGGHGADYI